MRAKKKEKKRKRKRKKKKSQFNVQNRQTILHNYNDKQGWTEHCINGLQAARVNALAEYFTDLPRVISWNALAPQLEWEKREWKAAYLLGKAENTQITLQQHSQI